MVQLFHLKHYLLALANPSSSSVVHFQLINLMFFNFSLKTISLITNVKKMLSIFVMNFILRNQVYNTKNIYIRNIADLYFDVEPVACITIVPEEYLHWHHQGCVDQ